MDSRVWLHSLSITSESHHAVVRSSLLPVAVCEQMAIYSPAPTAEGHLGGFQ